MCAASRGASCACEGDYWVTRLRGGAAYGARIKEIEKSIEFSGEGRRWPTLYRPTGVGFIFQFNGIGSTHLMSHVISYVQEWNDMKGVNGQISLYFLP